MASKDFTRLQIHYWIQIHNRCSTANGRSLQNLCTATFFESQPSARWTKGLRKATTGSLKKSNNQPINRYFVDCGHIVCPPNIWDLAPCAPPHPPPHLHWDTILIAIVLRASKSMLVDNVSFHNLRLFTIEQLNIPNISVTRRNLAAVFVHIAQHRSISTNITVFTQ